MVLAMIIWSLICAATFRLARVWYSFDYRTFFDRLLGPFAIVFELSYYAYVVLILSVFGAAAGAIGSAMFDWPALYGTLCLVAGIALFTAFGNASVERLFKWVSILLYATYAVFLVLSLVRFGGKISGNWLPPRSPPMTGPWAG
jgi:uncharacterized membrane protein YkvI